MMTIKTNINITVNAVAKTNATKRAEVLIGEGHRD